MTFFSLDDKNRQAGGNPAKMLREDPTGPYLFPFQEQFSNWRDEETAWATTATLFDQSFHMNDTYFTGPDVKRLFSENSVNNYEKFGRNRAKQIVVVNPEGDFIGDAIVFGFQDNQYVVVGAPTVAHWLSFRAQAGDYDVEIEEDPASPFNPNPRRKFRYQLQGPRSLDIIRKAAGDAVDHIKFFQMGELRIAGVPIRALNHTMVGVPGQESTGLEMTGPWAEGQRVLEALVKAGEEFGMRQGGSLAYSATAPIGGSLESDDIRDYYLTPWDLGYGRVINFGHEFVGRDGLMARKDEPHKTKVFLRWNDTDAGEAITSSLFDAPNGAKFMEMPSAYYVRCHYDQIRAGGARIGVGGWPAYVTNFGGWVQLGLIDDQYAKDGTEVELLWGNESAIGVRPLVEAHKMRGIRATVHTTPPLKSR